MVGSGFIAAFQSATIEIFSAKIRRGMRDRPPQPLGRRKPKSPLETPGVIAPNLGVDDARRPLAVERIENLLGGNHGHVFARFFGYARRMPAPPPIVDPPRRI